MSRGTAEGLLKLRHALLRHGGSQRHHGAVMKPDRRKCSRRGVAVRFAVFETLPATMRPARGGASRGPALRPAGAREQQGPARRTVEPIIERFKRRCAQQRAWLEPPKQFYENCCPRVSEEMKQRLAWAGLLHRQSAQICTATIKASAYWCSTPTWRDSRLGPGRIACWCWDSAQTSRMSNEALEDRERSAKILALRLASSSITRARCRTASLVAEVRPARSSSPRRRLAVAPPPDALSLEEEAMQWRRVSGIAFSVRPH